MKVGDCRDADSVIHHSVINGERFTMILGTRQIHGL